MQVSERVQNKCLQLMSRSSGTWSFAFPLHTSSQLNNNYKKRGLFTRTCNYELICTHLMTLSRDEVRGGKRMTKKPKKCAVQDFLPLARLTDSSCKINFSIKMTIDGQTENEKKENEIIKIKSASRIIKRALKWRRQNHCKSASFPFSLSATVVVVVARWWMPPLKWFLIKLTKLLPIIAHHYRRLRQRRRRWWWWQWPNRTEQNDSLTD